MAATPRSPSSISNLGFEDKGIASDAISVDVGFRSQNSESVCTGNSISLTRSEQRLEKVRVYCACNYDGRITLEDISRHVGMNKSAFCTFMRHTAGMSFSEYLNDMRLERAKDTLRHSDYGIAEIADMCGFQNVTYFNRLFRRKFGCSPKECRTNT